MSSADPSKFMATTDSSSSTMNIELNWGVPIFTEGSPKFYDNGMYISIAVFLQYWFVWGLLRLTIDQNLESCENVQVMECELLVSQIEIIKRHIRVKEPLH